MVKNSVPIQNRIKQTSEDKIFGIVVMIILTVFLLIVLYPLIYILSSSFSSAQAVSTGKVVLWPVDFSLEGYKTVFSYSSVWVGYGNSIIYTVVGTAINIAMTMMTAYALSCKTLPFGGVIMFLFTFTMIFDAGLIPNYIVIQQLGLIDTRWAILLPGAILAYNMIITKTFIATSIPQELKEAAEIDGCSDIQYFFKCVLPLSKAVIAVITLYYAVAHWNSYFSAFLYLMDSDLFPLQIILRDILIANSIDASATMDPELMAAKQGLADLLKYSLIIVASVPVMLIYPFIQKYFMQGVMIGSLKG